MAQVGRPRGLIDYCTEDDAAAEKQGRAPRPVLKTLLRPRTIAYFAIWGGIGVAMLFALGARTRIDISAQQDRNPIFVRLSDGAIRNAYMVKIRNMETRPRPIEVHVEGLPGAMLWTDAMARDQAAASLATRVPADSVAKLRIFVAAPPAGAPRQDFSFAVRATDREGGGAREDARFERP